MNKVNAIAISVCIGLVSATAAVSPANAVVNVPANVQKTLGDGDGFDGITGLTGGVYFVETSVEPAANVLPGFVKITSQGEAGSTGYCWLDTAGTCHTLNQGEGMVKPDVVNVGVDFDASVLQKHVYYTTGPGNPHTVTRDMAPSLKAVGVSGGQTVKNFQVQGVTTDAGFTEGYLDADGQFHHGQYVQAPAAKVTSAAPKANGGAKTLKWDIFQGKGSGQAKVPVVNKTLGLGQSYQLKFNSNYSWYLPRDVVAWSGTMQVKDGKKWNSVKSDGKAVSATHLGKLTAKKKGTTVVAVQTAYRDGGEWDYYLVVVKVIKPVTKITAASQKTLKAGAAWKIGAKADGDNAKLSYKSSNTKVATVSKGKVSAKKKGTAQITVTAKTGSSQSRV
ncbi:MAG: Ig-like domain-containing protein [Propionibacteriaceae bacterium]|jgi:hypothetical protein|nr:Ig-like domain-containing protein [Propionibacteriaceae bacterium]